MLRPDERDTIFSRMTLEPGSLRYREYYSANPERETVDQSFRDSPPGEFSDQIFENKIIDETFGLIAELRSKVRGPVALEKADIDVDEAAAFLKHNALKLGAASAGIAETKAEFIYSVRGRGTRYGTTVDKIHTRTIVFSFEMDRHEISFAPRPRQSAEVVRAYLKAAITALTTARFIRSLGWDAVAHIDGESEIVLPPAAAEAGLGELGRHGLLVTEGFGSRIRLSAVTTSLPLPIDDSVTVIKNGLTNFCLSCGKCAAECPSNAIPVGGVSMDDRRDFDSVDHEACFRTWKKFGTDCGICLAVCPFSK